MEHVSICDKAYLTLTEAADYFGIGVNKLRELTSEDGCPHVLWVGNKRLLKRKQLEKMLDSTYSI